MWSMQLRAVANTIRSPHELKAAMSPDERTAFAQACDSHPRFLPILTGALLSFLRIPTSVEPGAPSSHAVRPLTSLHHGRHYPSGRRFVLSPRQHNQPPRLIPIPALGHSPICPVRAWTRYVACLPTPLVPEITPLLRSTTAPRSEPASTKTRVSQACSLDTSLPVVTPDAAVDPEQLRTAPRPVKKLRRDAASAATATEFLKEIGYVAANQGKPLSDPNKAVWPEDYVDRLDGSEVTYESLTQRFMAGYLSIMEEDTANTPDNQKLLRLIRYLRGLMEDSFEVDWTTVRTAHKQVLLAIDHGRIRWEDQRACMDMKSNALQRVLRIPANTPAQKSMSAEKLVNPCPLYQSLSCLHPSDHQSDGVSYTHCCSYCHRTTGAKRKHPEQDCKKKSDSTTKPAKNGKRRRRNQQD